MSTDNIKMAFKEGFLEYFADRGISPSMLNEIMEKAGTAQMIPGLCKLADTGKTIGLTALALTLGLPSILGLTTGAIGYSLVGNKSEEDVVMKRRKILTDYYRNLAETVRHRNSLSGKAGNL